MFNSLKNALRAQRNIKTAHVALQEEKSSTREAKARKQKEELIKSSGEVRRSQERLRESNEKMNDSLDRLKKTKPSNEKIFGDCLKEAIDKLDKN